MGAWGVGVDRLAAVVATLAVVAVDVAMAAILGRMELMVENKCVPKLTNVELRAAICFPK